MLTPAARLQTRIHQFLKNFQKVTFPVGMESSYDEVSIDYGMILNTSKLPNKKYTEINRKGSENPPMANKAEPIAGPIIRPTPERASTSPAAFDIFSGKQLTIIE